jgi:poly-beta-1,6-N-acetyl-D-glucosamine synthase
MNSTDCPEPIRCSMGIMAYNEESNVGRLLEAILPQCTTRVFLAEIIVVASGCIDGTEAVVKKWAEEYPRIRLIAQARREGKASAVNWFLSQAGVPNGSSMQRLAWARRAYRKE